MTPTENPRHQVEGHVPGVRPVPKMDTPVGLFGGTCSCGWRSTGLETESRALRSAEAHARARGRS